MVKIDLKRGFTIHPQNTTSVPSTMKELLGFIIDSIAMTVSLHLSKKGVLIDLAFSMRSVSPSVELLGYLD